MCFVWILEQTAVISLYSINYGFKTEAESVYCALRNGSLNQTDTISYLNGKPFKAYWLGDAPTV